MRADAQRNADKLRSAAADVFGEQGLNASLKEIARRAGVSHGTLYNIFGTREALIDEVVTDLAAAALDAAAVRALSCKDPWQGFASYLEDVCALQASNTAVGDVVVRRVPGAERLLAVCDRTRAAAERIIDRAHTAGVLRTDFTIGDMLVVFGTNAVLAHAAADAAPNAWRRSILFLLDGLRADSATLLPDESATAADVLQLAKTLAGSV